VRRLLLDTGVAADYIFRRGNVYSRARQEAARGTAIGVSITVLGELFAGAEYSATRDRNRRRLVHQLQDLIEWPYDHRAAEEFGRLYAWLRRTGRLMQQIDMQTAAIVRTLAHCALVTRDSDFHVIPGLTIESW
jgi:tRNA(fMet)-specific endonuclease VapC